MKKVFLFFYFVHSLFICSAQSKVDTEEWIKTQIEEYHYNDKYGFNNYEVSFDKTYMIVLAPGGKNVFYNKIPLNLINQATVTYFKIEDREGYTIKLKCKGTEKCIEEGRVINGEYEKPPDYITLKNLYLNTSFKTDNLPERMKKALKHLIELNGGKLINDTF